MCLSFQVKAHRRYQYQWYWKWLHPLLMHARGLCIGDYPTLSGIPSVLQIYDRTCISARRLYILTMGAEYTIAFNCDHR